MPYRFPKLKVMFAIYFLLLIAPISRSAANKDGLVIKIGMEKTVHPLKKFSKYFDGWINLKIFWKISSL